MLFLRISRAAVNNRAELQVGRDRRKGNLINMVVKQSGVKQMSKDEVGGGI